MRILSICLFFFTFLISHDNRDYKYYYFENLTREIYQNPYKYFTRELSKKDTIRYKNIINNNIILKKLIKPTFSISEIRYISNVSTIVFYIAFLDYYGNSNKYMKNKITDYITWYHDNLNYFTREDMKNYLKSYIKIASMCDGYFCYSFGDGFSKLININQLFFINTIRKMDFIDNMCGLIRVGADNFNLTDETKEIYKKNFDENDTVIKKIFECEKKFNSQ